MTHEPECPVVDIHAGGNCICCNAIRAAYRRGYNDHAAAQQHWQDTHGAYRVRPGDLDIHGNVYLLVNQHGEGDNP
jgi:hypothetical protein